MRANCYVCRSYRRKTCRGGGGAFCHPLSWTGLIFSSQPNLTMESRVHSFVHSVCHHQIAYTKFNLKIFYSPQYELEVWHYQNTPSAPMRIALNGRSTLLILKQKSTLLNQTTKNIISKYIPHENRYRFNWGSEKDVLCARK